MSEFFDIDKLTTPRIYWEQCTEVGHMEWYDGPLTGLTLYRGTTPCWYFLSGGDTNSTEHTLVEITDEQAEEFKAWQNRMATWNVKDGREAWLKLNNDYSGPKLDKAKVVGWTREEWGVPPSTEKINWNVDGF